MTELANDTPAAIGLTSHWLVIYKPAGWLTIPGREEARRTHSISGKIPTLGVLSDWAVERYGNIWVTHRIDRETSGIVLFARSADQHRLANSWFQAHQIKKTYYALAEGVPATPIFKVNAAIEGAPSVTQFEVVESYREGFFTKVLPVTGRRHQIRVHLASVKHALWGDSTYGGSKQIVIKQKLLNVPRVALHAGKIELPTGEIFEAYLPKDFSHWLERLRKDGTRL